MMAQNHNRQQVSTTGAIRPGFADPVFDQQRAFRTVMAAMAEPGTIHGIKTTATCPQFSPAMTALALTLIDFETAISTDAGELVEAYLRFHTGARVVRSFADVDFAFLARPRATVPLAAFRQGTLDYPDRSCTVVLEVGSLSPRSMWSLSGPGILGQRTFEASPLGEDFRAQHAASRKRFPLGVDVILCAGDRIAALPRSTIIARAEGR